MADAPLPSPRGQHHPHQTVVNTEGDFEQTIAALLAQSATDEDKIAKLTELVRQQRAELLRLKSAQTQHILQFEKEEEFISNKLLQRLDKLKTEKDELVLRVEQEEEYLTNTLQKKLALIAKEKEDLQNLQKEEESAIASLQKQLADAMEDKIKLEKQLEEERNYETKNQELKQSLKKLKTENFTLEQKIKQEKEKTAAVIREKAILESGAEMMFERSFNTAQKRGGMAGRDRRGRSFSLPVNEPTQGTVSPPEGSPVSSPRGGPDSSPPQALSAPVTRTRRMSQGKAAGMPHISPNILGKAKALKSGWMKYKHDTISQNLFFVLYENGELAAYPSDDMRDPNNFSILVLNMDTVTHLSRAPEEPDTMLVVQMTKDGCTLVTKSLEESKEWERWLTMLSPVVNSSK